MLWEVKALHQGDLQETYQHNLQVLLFAWRQVREAQDTGRGNWMVPSRPHILLPKTYPPSLSCQVIRLQTQRSSAFTQACWLPLQKSTPYSVASAVRFSIDLCSSGRIFRDVSRYMEQGVSVNRSMSKQGVGRMDAGSVSIRGTGPDFPVPVGLGSPQLGAGEMGHNPDSTPCYPKTVWVHFHWDLRPHPCPLHRYSLVVQVRCGWGV